MICCKRIGKRRSCVRISRLSMNLGGYASFVLTTSRLCARCTITISWIHRSYSAWSCVILLSVFTSQFLFTYNRHEIIPHTAFQKVLLMPVYTGECIFCCTIRCNFYRAQITSSHRVCKLAAISVRFGRNLSRECRRSFEQSCSKPDAT